MNSIDNMNYHDCEQQPFLKEQFSEEIRLQDGPAQPEHYQMQKRLIKALVVICLMSSIGNCLGIYSLFRNFSSAAPSHDRSLYARLERDVAMPFHTDTLFSPANRSLSDAAWESWAVDPGIVALPHDWVKQKMLPQSQQWPWDKSMGIYLLNGYHAIHCLAALRKTIITLSEGKGSEDDHYSLEHHLHCIEQLRQDALCNADDTPRYSGYSQHEKAAGSMQMRMCRSWDKLEAWAKDHTACYRDVGRDVEGYPMIEKFKFCPPGYIFSATGSPIAPWKTGSGVSQPGDD